MNETLLEYALATPDHIKAFLNPTMRSDQDDAIVRMINAFSIMAQDYCNRSFLKANDIIEYLDGGRVYVQTHSPPIRIDVIAKTGIVVYDDLSRVFDNTRKLTLWDHYTVDEDTGLVKLISIFDPWILTTFQNSFSPGPRCVKVQYNGGCVKCLDGGAVFECPADLNQACIEQVSFVFKNRAEIGSTGISTPTGASIHNYTPTKLLPEVMETLERYKIHEQ